MPSIATERSHVDPCSSSGTSPPAESWEDRVTAWCWACASVEELAFMVRTARGLDQLETAMAVIRERKGQGVALAVAKCL